MKFVSVLFLSLFFLSLQSQSLDSLAYAYAQGSSIDTIYDYRKKCMDQFHPVIRELIETDPVTARNANYINYTGDLTQDLHLYTYSFRVHSGFFQYFLILDYQGQIDTFSQRSRSIVPVSNAETYPLKDWYGALYYNMIPKKVEGMDYYFLLAFRDLDHRRDEKMVDVLYRDEGQWKLGKEGFFDEDETRYSLLYAQQAAVKLNYNQDEGMIVHDHLIVRSIDGVLADVPDGSYVGLKWKKKRWQVKEKMFSHISKEAPRPYPIMDSRNKDIFGN